MPQKMIFEWSAGAHVMLDAQEAGQHLEEIKVRCGELTPAAVVDDARMRDSPLHPYFEWDDCKAAAKHREDQARYLIRHLVVRIEEEDEKAPERAPVRAFFSVEDRQARRSYVPMAEAMSDADMRKQVLERGLNELHGWRRRYADLTEFSKVYSAIDSTQKKLEL
jgi:hypothetical protein